MPKRFEKPPSQFSSLDDFCEPIKAKSDSTITQLDVDDIVAKNLKRKKPSKWVSKLGSECLALRKAIEYQLRCYAIKETEAKARETKLTDRIRHLEQTIADLADNKGESFFRRTIKSKLARLLDEVS